MASAIILKWYYYHITRLEPDKPYVEPSIDVEKWKLPMYKQWLNVHGQEYDGKVSDLRNNILLLKSNAIILHK